MNRNEPIHIVYVRTEKCTGAVIRYRPSNAYLCLRVLLKTTPQRRATQLIITSLSWWSLCKRKPCSHMFDGGRLQIEIDGGGLTLSNRIPTS